MSPLTIVLLTIHFCGFVVAFIISMIAKGIGFTKKSSPEIFLMCLVWEIFIVGSLLGSAYEKFNKLNL